MLLILIIDNNLPETIFKNIFYFQYIAYYEEGPILCKIE